MSFMYYDLEPLVPADHQLRKINELVDFSALAYRIKDCASDAGRHGYGLEVAIKCLFLQFYYDRSDRQFETQIRDSIAIRWFLGIGIDKKTPDHTFFSRMRSMIGTNRIGKIFRKINEKVSDRKDILGKTFYFVDASAIKTKETTWKERDKAIENGEDDLNNKNISNYGADPDAKFGCKGKDKFWYGYKRHICSDMKQGIITKVAVTPANVPDQDGLKYTCPPGGMVFGDKAYGLAPARKILDQNNCHSGAVLKDNAKNKNRDKDKWLTKVRMSYENIFSKNEKRARYRGTAKVQMQAFIEAIVHNVKRLIVIGCPPLFVSSAA